MTETDKLKIAYTASTFEHGFAVHFRGTVMFYTEGRHVIQRDGDDIIHILDKDFKILGLVHADHVLAINRIPKPLPESEVNYPSNYFVQ